MNREFKFNLEKIEETGVFYGTAAVYGNVDLGGDVIEAGAFTKSLAENGGKVPLLLDHRIPIGLAEVEDSPFGLKTRGILNMDKEVARDSYSDLKFYQANGKQYGMSIGYNPTKKKREGDIRILKEVQLFETSITITPMNQLARVGLVKSTEDQCAFLEAWYAAHEHLKSEEPDEFKKFMERFALLINVKALEINGEGTPATVAAPQAQIQAATPSSEPDEIHSMLESYRDRLREAVAA